jgi:hypothetical protein
MKKFVEYIFVRFILCEMGQGEAIGNILQFQTWFLINGFDLYVSNEFLSSFYTRERNFITINMLSRIFHSAQNRVQISLVE